MAMGFRTPGEKTAFEVDTLNTVANRIFNKKARQFERQVMEPLLTGMLESAKREMVGAEDVLVPVDEVSAAVFNSITKEDITANGTFQVFGARRFAETSLRIQTINTMLQVKAMSPDIGVHWSGKQLAKIMAEELDEQGIFKENVQIEEQKEIQSAISEAEVDYQEEQMVAAEQGL